MGQTGIRSVLDLGIQETLRQELENQLRDYSAIETEAHSIAAQRGWDLREVGPAGRLFTDIGTRARANGRYMDSAIAGIVIQRSTKGMVRGQKELNRIKNQDRQVHTLYQRLLDREAEDVRKMQNFL